MRHPSTYKIPCFNFCYAMGKSNYVSIFLKASKGTAKTIHNETFKDNDRSITMKIRFGFVMFIFRFFSSSANFLVSEAFSKCTNEVSSTLICNSLIFCLQLERKSIRNSEYVCTFQISCNYYYDVLF